MTTILLAIATLAAPPDAAKIRTVDAAQVHELVARRNATLVDTRSAAEYQQAHIAGAIHIPAERTQLEKARLPADRNTPVVFYCRGVG